MTEMTEDCNDIPIGIILSMVLYAMYIHITSKLLHIYKLDNRIMFIIYFVPLVVFYIEIPILLRRFNRWRKYAD